MKKTKTTITNQDAGFGAFCNICQHEENRYMRFAHTFKCVKVHLENENGKSTIFMCDKCVDLIRANYSDHEEVELVIAGGE